MLRVLGNLGRLHGGRKAPVRLDEKRARLQPGEEGERSLFPADFFGSEGESTNSDSFVKSVCQQGNGTHVHMGDLVTGTRPGTCSPSPALFCPSWVFSIDPSLRALTPSTEHRLRDRHRSKGVAQCFHGLSEQRPEGGLFSSQLYEGEMGHRKVTLLSRGCTACGLKPSRPLADSAQTHHPLPPLHGSQAPVRGGQRATGLPSSDSY